MILGLCPECGQNKALAKDVDLIVGGTPTRARVCEECANLIKDRQNQRALSRSKTSGGSETKRST